MKTLTKTLLFLMVAGCGVSLLAHPRGGSNGTDIFHYSATKRFANDGPEPAASGEVEVHQINQGDADHQQVSVSVRGLAAGATCELLVNGDTNLSDGVAFTTDERGNAEIQLRTQGNAHVDRHGYEKGPLPSTFDPVFGISELDVFNASGQAVLTADMTTPDRLYYLVKRDLSTNNVDAFLRIEATTDRTRFDLRASGLNPAENYLLVVNGTIVETDTTDSRGHLDIASRLVSGNILSISSAQLWDASSNVVFTTTLP